MDRSDVTSTQDHEANSSPTTEPARIRVRQGRAVIPTLRSEEPCPGCGKTISMPMAIDTPQGKALVGLVPADIGKRGAEVRAECSCGHALVLYTSRLIGANGKVRR